MTYIDLKYEPAETDLVCEFRLEPATGISMRKAAEAIAADSTGTWADVVAAGIAHRAAKVFWIGDRCARIAYPLELFELGNMAQILSLISGNIFGMHAVRTLRLEDVRWPEQLMRSFLGPLYGIPGVRKLLHVPERPLCGTIIKPKLGLAEREHAQVAYEAWIGGIDIITDDYSLGSMAFNKFERRIIETLKARDKAERKTGERKMYMPNVTCETHEMHRRAKFVRDHGGECVMINIITAGWAGLHSLRCANQDLRLVLHASRAGHAAFTRNRRHGISALVVADIARLIGVDQLHIGTAVGKMAARFEVIEMYEEIEKGFITGNGHKMAKQWRHVLPVFAVCSGGLHPGLVPALVRALGKDIIIQAGIGVHNHPHGTRAGAAAMRQAIDAVLEHIPLPEYARTHRELKAAIGKWRALR